MTEQQQKGFGGMGDLLKGISENPEMLSKAMNIASMLASSGALDSMMGKVPKENPTVPPLQTSSEEKTDRSDRSDRSDTTKKAVTEGAGKKGGYRERIALLEAMRPFISDTKKDRLELLIRILGVMELYDGVKSGGRMG